MGEDRILLTELLLLGLWLGGPALIGGLVIQALVLWRRGLRGRVRRRRLLSSLLISGILAYVLIFPLWVGMSALPTGWGGESVFMLGGILMLPAVVSVCVVCPAVSYLALRGARGSPTSA